MFRYLRVSWIKPIIPVFIGICLGITLNIMLTQFFDESCNIDLQAEAAENNHIYNAQEGLNNRRIKKNSENINIVPENFVPPPLEQGDAKKKKLIRPRFASTELGIREKLLVGVLTSANAINSFAVAINKTLSHYVPKTIFFTNNMPSSIPSGMTIHTVSNQQSSLLPLYAMQFIKDHYAETYDYYMFITDKTYIRAEKIYEFVSHISVSNDIYMGLLELSEESEKFCSLEGGVIISQSVMVKTLAQLPWCMENGHFTSASITLGQCVQHATDMGCGESFQDKEYRYYKVDDFDFEYDIEVLRTDTKFNASLSVFPLPDDLSFYKIHRYFCQLELNLTRQEVDKAKENIVNLSQFGPGGRDSLTWPIGLPDRVKTQTRFEINRWTYFTEDHLYFDDDFTNMKKLQGSDKEDIEEILNVAFNKLNSEYDHIYTKYQLVNGYRRFEPMRGMEYTVDLGLAEDNVAEPVLKRVHLIRPLNRAEVIPVPYVTETTRVNLVVPVYPEDKDDVSAFLDSFTKTVVEGADNTYLLLILVYPSTSRNKPDIHAIVKTTINYYNNKAQIRWKTIETNFSKVPDLDLVDMVIRDFPDDALLAFGTPYMEVDQDFLNRVRMNTIVGFQVFFPIPFSQYKKNLAYDKEPYPVQVELSSKYGHFDAEAYEYGSFYVDDYISNRKTVPASNLKRTELKDMFVRNPQLHFFRAADPSLRQRWKHLTCSGPLPDESFNRCSERRAEGLANRAQLAKLIFEHEESLD